MGPCACENLENCTPRQRNCFLCVKSVKKIIKVTANTPPVLGTQALTCAPALTLCDEPSELKAETSGPRGPGKGSPRVRTRAR